MHHSVIRVRLPKMKTKVKKKIQVADTLTIKTLIAARGLTQQIIARRLKEHHSKICDVIAGRRKTPKIQNGIAKILGVKRAKIFFISARRYERENNGRKPVGI